MNQFNLPGFFSSVIKVLNIRALGSISTLLITALLTRLNVSLLGMYSFVVSVTEVSIVVAHFGIGPRLVKDFGNRCLVEKINSVYRSNAEKVWFRTLVVALVILTFLMADFSPIALEGTGELILFFTPIVATSFCVFISYFLVATGNVWQGVLSRNVLASAVFCLILGLYVVLHSEYSFLDVALLFAASRILAALGSVALAEKTLGIEAKAFCQMRIPGMREFRFHDKTQTWFFLGQMTETLNRHITFVILGVGGGLENLGLLTFVVKVCLPIEILFVVLQQQSVSLVSNYIEEKRWRALKRLMLVVSVCGVVFSVLYFVVVSFGFDFILDFLNLQSSGVELYHCWILLAAYAINAVTSVSGPVLQIGGLEERKFWIGAGALSAQLALVLLSFAFNLGLTGVSIAIGMGISMRAGLEGYNALRFSQKQG